jgi:hypothetical protein
MMGETSHQTSFAVIPWNGIQAIGSIAPSLWISSTKHTVGWSTPKEGNEHYHWQDAQNKEEQ